MSTPSQLSSTSATASGRSQSTQAERTADARKVFLRSFHQASAELDADLQSRAKIIHENSLALKKQESNAQNEAKKLAKENDSLEKFIAKSSKKVSEFEGLKNDFEGLDALEDDLGDIEAMLDMLEAKGKQSNLPSSTNSSR